MTDIPDNNATTATIGVGQIVSGTLETAADHDWYRVSLTAGQSVTIAVYGAGTNPVTDTDLTLYDSSGAAVATNDDNGGSTDAKVIFTPTTSGVYFIDAGAYGDRLTGSYAVSVQSYTAPPVWSYDQIANQLVNGYWNAQGGQTAHHFDVHQGGTITVNLTELTAQGQILARAALQEWSDIIGVTFTEVTGTNVGQIIFDDTRTGAFTDDSWSNGITTSAHVNISTQWLADYGADPGQSALNSYAFQTYLHEIGHALGLGHAGNYDDNADYAAQALFSNDAWSTTVMSYFSDADNAYFASQGFSDQFFLTPMVGDIAAMQDLYGLSTTTRTGDTTYGFHSNAGRDVFDATIVPTAGYTVFDSGGNDTLDYSGYAKDQLINLNSGTFSNVGGGVGNVSIAPGTVIENAIGGSGNDQLIGNDAANVLTGNAGHDVLIGGAGDDFLVGGDGPDTLTGGIGNDTFAGTMMGLYSDTITDFGAGDRILITDASLSTFTFNLQGTTLTYNGFTLNLGSAPSGDLLVSTAPEGGIQLTLTQGVTYGYDTQGRVISETINNPDGSHTWSSLDVDNAQNWSQVWFNYDAQGHEVSVDYRYDDGTRSWTALDAFNTQPWDQVWFTYDNQGRQISEDYRYDDGTRSWVAYDVGNTQTWKQVWFSYDAAGNEVSETYTYDDGTKSWVAIDASHAQVWDKVWFSYDASGRETSEDHIFDDGTRNWIAFDADGSKPWSKSWYHYDAQGHLVEQVITWNDGHTTDTHF